MNDSEYQHKLEEIFVRFPSVQNTGFGEAYKPGLAHMEEFDALTGSPSKSFRSVHVAGTNGKGSVANMLASALAATGLKVGLYTSPHILDFRERMRILDGGSGNPVRLISKEAVWDFITEWEEDFNRLNLSFFEITTGMAFRWFADEKVDIAVIEVGLGGRLDSTNIITPEVAVVTSIGLDHCAQLGDTRAAIAGEKAGIFKPGVPAVVGTRDAETAPVFEAAASAAPCPLIYADAGQECCSAGSSAFAKSSAASLPASANLVIPVKGTVPGSLSAKKEDCADFEPGTGSEKFLARAGTQAFRALYPGERIEQLLKEMDLQGEWQAENLRTALTVLGVLGVEPTEEVLQAIAHTARRMDFHGRWEMLRRDPDMLCDIGHNPPALARNFAQLEEYLRTGRYDRLIIVYGVMADKDLDGIMPLMPQEATYITVAPDTPRAMKADVLFARLSSAFPGKVLFGGSVTNGIELALGLAADGNKPLIYIGGSTFVVSEAVAALSGLQTT
jgi:dihydrofolate synthase/folylpolyglutamate synthase